jgi:UDP-glucose 4-epimerase
VIGFTPAAASRRPKVAITGGAGFLGSRLIRALAPKEQWDIVVFDLAPAPNVPVEVRHRFLDLNLPHADGSVYKLLMEEKPDVVIHLAALRSPSHDYTYIHELNSLGALHVLAAAGEAKTPRLIVGSTTMVYGARGDNPNFLTEDHPMRADLQDRFVLDFVEAERHARTHARRYPDSKVAVLRFAQVLSPEIRDYKTRYFEAPAAVTMLGYDPLLQFLHPEDATSALLRTLENPSAHGTFNIVPDGVLPLSTILLLYGTLPVPVPHTVAYAAIEAAWLAGVGFAPGIQAHFIRYNCIAGNEKARKVLGWNPAWSSFDTVLQTVRVRRSKGRVLNFEAIAEAARRSDYQHQQRESPFQTETSEPGETARQGATSFRRVAR